VKEILKRFDSLEKKIEAKIESEAGGLRTEFGTLRGEMLSRMAELEMRVTTALLDAVRSNQELAAELRKNRLARDDRFDALEKRLDALEKKVG
jgi:tetrahydromethanopterin S-methyltransferase subunit G